MLALTAAPPPHNNPPSTCQAIALLPFIDAARLRAALAPLRSHLADGEKLRDAHGDNLLFAACHPPSAAEPPSVGLGRSVAKACPCAPRGAPTTNASTIVLQGDGAQGTLGTAAPASVRHVDGPLDVPRGGADAGLAPLPTCHVAAVRFFPPAHRPHVPRLLAGVTLPPPVLGAADGPKYSRDADHATRTMATRLGGGGGGGRAQGGGGDRRGPRSGPASTPATRMITASLNATASSGRSAGPARGGGSHTRF